MRRLALVCVLALWSASSAFGEAPLLPPGAIDLPTILPPPPVADTKAERDDISTVIAIQAASSPERRAQAVADAEISPERFAGALLGPAFTRANLPKTFAVLRRVAHEGGALSERAKDFWKRPRPFLVDARITSLVPKPPNPAYPSGHTTYAYEMAIVLGAMLPERRADLFARAADYGQSRIIVGVHYLTDIDAGRVAGTAIAALLLDTEQMRADVIEAGGELRAALGLPPRPHG